MNSNYIREDSEPRREHEDYKPDNVALIIAAGIVGAVLIMIFTWGAQ